MARKSHLPEIRKTAPRHLHWMTMRTYKGLYQSDKGDTITIRSVTKPKRVRVFRSSLGRRKYRLTKLTSTTREVIIVAKAKTKNRKKPVDQEELEELEALEELEDLDEDDEEDEDVEDTEDDEEDDEEEPDDEDEDEDEEEDEEPPKSKKSKSKKSKTTKKKGQSRAAADGKVGTQEVAAHFDVTPRALRMVLRRHKIDTDEDSGRYEWSSLKHPEVIKIGKLLAKGAAKQAQRESLEKLKSKKGKSKKGTSTKKKSSTKKRRSRKADDEDED